jgi:hypothetical protein
MSILSGYLSMTVERITAPTGVRRVERDRGADEFNRRQQDAQNGKRSPHEDEDEEIPEDVVDLSGEYRAPNLPVPASRPAPAASPAPPSDRHIDISG